MAHLRVLLEPGVRRAEGTTGACTHGLHLYELVVGERWGRGWGGEGGGGGGCGDGKHGDLGPWRALILLSYLRCGLRELLRGEVNIRWPLIDVGAGEMWMGVRWVERAGEGHASFSMAARGGVL